MTERLSDDEFKQMISLISRYVETDMDQWELWKFESSFHPIYINISMKSQGADEAYNDLTHLIDN